MLHAIFSLTRTQSIIAATVAAFFTSVVITALITLLAPFYCIPRSFSCTLQNIISFRTLIIPYIVVYAQYADTAA